MLNADAKIQHDHVLLALGEGIQGTGDFAAQRIVVLKVGIGSEGIGVHQYVEQAVVFAFGEWCIYRYMAGGYAEGGFYFFNANF